MIHGARPGNEDFNRKTAQLSGLIFIIPGARF
jgi:hypothetical protein